jgi:hypothetical protein
MADTMSQIQPQVKRDRDMMEALKHQQGEWTASYPQEEEIS